MSRSRTFRAGSVLLAVSPLVLTGLVALGAPAYAAPPPGTIPGAWIVTLEEGAAPERVSSEHARRHGAAVDHVYRHAVHGYAARMSAQAAAQVAEDPRVQSVVPDRVVTIAGRKPKEPAPAPAPAPAPQTVPTGVYRIDGDSSTALSGNGTGSVDVDVAVLDTGIDVDHPDLDVVGGVNCARGRSYDDGNGHGTHVAGTIGAKDDASGVVGVAPGARLWAVRVLDNQGNGSWSSIICGVDWVTANSHTIDVANMSLGGDGTEPGGTGCATGDALHDAICASVDAGVTYSVAAGNDGVDAVGSVPAAYDEVITVSALADFNGGPGGGGTATCRADVDDTFADFSNFGADIDLIAPGVCITSTWRGGGYDTISGTSMASPHVAGAAALYAAADPTASPAEVQAALVAAGNAGWDAGDDRDRNQEPLLSVAGL